MDDELRDLLTALADVLEAPAPGLSSSSGAAMHPVFVAYGQWLETPEGLQWDAAREVQHLARLGGDTPEAWESARLTVARDYDVDAPRWLRCSHCGHSTTDPVTCPRCDTALASQCAAPQRIARKAKTEDGP